MLAHERVKCLSGREVVERGTLATWHRVDARYP